MMDLDYLTSGLSDNDFVNEKGESTARIAIPTMTKQGVKLENTVTAAVLNVTNADRVLNAIETGATIKTTVRGKNAPARFRGQVFNRKAAKDMVAKQYGVYVEEGSEANPPADDSGKNRKKRGKTTTVEPSVSAPSNGSTVETSV